MSYGTSPDHGAEARRSLRAAASVLLSADSEATAVNAAAREVHALLSEVAGLTLEPQSPDEIEEKLLASGKAISPRAAALFLTDDVRSAMFVRGVHAALTDLRARFPEDDIEVVYAGCGPFAPLCVLPLLFAETDGIRFTLIDAHQRSLDAARRIVGALGFEDNVRAYICSDARVPESRRAGDTPGDRRDYGARLAERAAGSDYRQSCATVERWRSFHPGERLGGGVPDGQGQGVHAPEAPEPDRIRLGELLEVSARTAPALRLTATVRVEIPRVTSNRYMLALLTLVHVYGPHPLDVYASGFRYRVCARS